MRATPRRLVLAGSITGEVRVAVPHAPEPGRSARADLRSVLAAGGLRPLVAAGRLGLPTAVGGRFGSGPIGQLVQQAVRRHGIDMLLPPTAGDQGHVVLLVEPHGRTTRIECPGIEQGLTIDELRSLPIREGDAVLIDGYDLLSPVAGESLATWVEEGGIGTGLLVFCPGPLSLDIPEHVIDRVLARADVVEVDAHEFALLAGSTATSDHAAAARDVLAGLSPEALLISRDDAHGCWYDGQGRSEYLKVPRPVALGAHAGAGDVMLGTLVAELARGVDPFTAVRHGVLAWTIPPSTPRTSPDGLPLYAVGPSRAALDAAIAGA